ncbi:MAG: transglycosylase domain-containing protein, partial [Anaerolineae bacterium]|nr:transglycosylase domain-containing protein [Anaerolineae bacterium]
MGFAAVAATAAIIGLIIYTSLSAELEQDMAKLQSMEGVEDFEVTRIYDRKGNMLYELFDEGRRTEVTLEEIPYVLRWATVATEDNTFYENPGFDPQSIARAAWEWAQQGEIVS